MIALAAGGIMACGGDEGSKTSSEAQREAPVGGAADTDAAGGNARAREPAFSGDVPEARAGAKSVDQIYAGIGAAVDAGVSATDVAARQTLESADGNKSLTTVCDLMSEQAQRQTVEYAKRSAGLADVKWNCEKATGLLLRRARQSGGLKKSLRAKVVGVNVEGDRATASVRFGGRGPVSSVPLVREDGEWKLAASPAGG